MVNKTELRRALDLVLDADAKGLHDQTNWIIRFDCGTGGCFAGTYALNSGCTPVWWMDNDYLAYVRSPDGLPCDVAEWVRSRLGLTKEQAILLFAVNNSIADLKEIVDEICGEEG